ncbi:MAG: DegV family protein [Anaerolineales bacterium]|nr:DegV family protein [Anaerolineales bacterium]
MKIVTDCAADLTAEDIAEHGITVAPLFIQFPNQEISATEIAPDEFYDRLRQMSPEIPTTAQPSAELFTRLYEQLSQSGEEVCSIHISSGLSGTVDSARLGANHVRDGRVHVFDSLTLSGGQRFQVLAAAKAFQAGWSLEAVTRRLEQLRESTEVIFTLETLTYLARGGRIGRVQALAGALLNIKPLIRGGAYGWEVQHGWQNAHDRQVARSDRRASCRGIPTDAVMGGGDARAIRRTGAATGGAAARPAERGAVGDFAHLAGAGRAYRSGRGGGGGRAAAAAGRSRVS